MPSSVQCLNTLRLYGLHSPLYVDNLIEFVQHKALRIIFPAVDYNSALYQSGLKTVNERRKEICTNLFLMYEVTVWSQNAPYSLLLQITPLAMGYGLGVLPSLAPGQTLTV